MPPTESPIMPPPSISVVIPTLDGASRLPETLASVIGQEVRGGVQLVVVDDGSSDASREVAASTGTSWGPTQVLRHELPRGRAEACNLGIAAAQSPVVVILDDDMTLMPGALDAHARFHGDNPGRGVVARVMQDMRLRADSSFSRFLAREEANRERMLLAQATSVPFPLCLTGHFSAPRSLLETLGGFDTRIRLYGLEDIELAFRFAQHGVRIAYLEDAVALHRDDRNDLDRYLTRHEHVGVVARQLAARYPGGPFREFLRVDGPGRLGVGRDRVGLVALRLSNRLLLRSPVRRALSSRPGRVLLRSAIGALEAAGLDRAAHFAYHVARDVRYFEGYFRTSAPASDQAPEASVSQPGDAARGRRPPPR